MRTFSVAEGGPRSSPVRRAFSDLSPPPLGIREPRAQAAVNGPRRIKDVIRATPRKRSLDRAHDVCEAGLLALFEFPLRARGCP